MNFSTGLEGFCLLLPWFRRDRTRYTPDRVKTTWFQWGYINERDGKPYKWYILIALPCYSMRKDQLDIRGPDAPPTMRQHHLLFMEPIPSGAGGWSEIFLECDP